MGLDPNDAPTDIILNGGFVGAANWTALRDWTIGGGKATLTVIQNPVSTLFQASINCMPGQQYEILFDLANANFADPAKGISVTFDVHTWPTIFRTNGSHSIIFVPANDMVQLAFRGPSFAIGDSVDLDNVEGINEGDYINEKFPLNLSSRYRKEVFAATDADLFQNVADTTDKTSCQILFNHP